MEESTILSKNRFIETQSIFETKLPDGVMEISRNSFVGICAYSVVFIISLFGQTFVLYSLWRQFNIKKSRIFLLLLHLSVADLIVCLIIVPTEIVWRLSYQWESGNFLCKATQYFREFGLYLSSLILICLNFDRFISIIFPLKAIGMIAYRRIKWLIAIVCIGADVLSIPQALIFEVTSHPEYADHKQCVTSSFPEEGFRSVKIYTLFSIVAMYFVPLVVITLTYIVIFLKSGIKSNRQFCKRTRMRSNPDYVRSTTVTTMLRLEVPKTVCRIQPRTFHLRSSRNAMINLKKAMDRTLMLTIVIVVAFIVCWTPYAVMTLWYNIDWDGAKLVDPRIQDALFLMVVSPANSCNSCKNPFIYGGFNRKILFRTQIFC